MTEKKPCPTCQAPSVFSREGTASRQAYYRCTNNACGREWREKNPAAVALGRLGGAATASGMSEEEREARARNAAEARWRNERLAKNVKPGG